MTNTAARGQDLNEFLLNQWHLVDCSQNVRKAGEALINYIDQEGYLRTPLELIAREWREPIDPADLAEALKKMQKLEPSGVGARTLQECLLIQLEALEEDYDAFDDHDFDLEKTLVKDHLKDLEMNRYPQIAKKLGREIGDVKAAVRGLSRLTPHPGKLFAPDEAQPITPDATIYFDEETKKYEVKMSRESSPHIYISRLYRNWLKNREGEKQTREFLSKNLRNARWLMESIEQRAGTIQRVIKAVVEHQREFFDKGPEFLKPLPMLQVADQLGIHVATVSRAVSEKWVQTPRGVMPLRRFFSGGTTSSEGEDMSWDAVKEKLRQIVDNEDKKEPLNDDVIVEKLKEQGITLARRTVAKYRKILNIAPSRQRREFA
jgi:RNA polymerase sigma-54 factor